MNLCHTKSCKCDDCVQERAALDAWRRSNSDKPYEQFRFWFMVRREKLGLNWRTNRYLR